MRIDAQPRLTARRRENLVRLTTNAATVIFAGLIIGSFIGGAFHPSRLVIGIGFYLAAVATIWRLEA